jgi:hypothetical protein
VKVKDRAIIITTPDETCVASPSSLQEAIDTEVGKLFFVFIILRTSSDSVKSLDRQKKRRSVLHSIVIIV